MALNIKNPQVEQLAQEIAEITGESKTEVIRQALLERRSRLRYHVVSENRRSRLEAFLAREIWSRVPADQTGRAPTQTEIERILGYGEAGV